MLTTPKLSPTAVVQVPAPPPQTVAQVLLSLLKMEGVTHVFGIPGGGIANLITELKNERSEIQYVICRHETGAAYMADGYFRASGNLGVVLVTTGPGATNALTGTMNAQNGCTAMLTITGEVNEQFFGKGYLQEGADTGLDVTAIYAAATRYSSMVVDQSDLVCLVKQALRDALSVPRRAVHLSMPNNVAAETVNPLVMPKSPASYRAVPQGAPSAQVGEALQMIVDAKRPLIFLGAGCRAAMRDDATRQMLIDFAERFAIPVMTTPDGKGVFPESHEMSLRAFGCASSMWPYYWMKGDASQPLYDALLVIGSSLGDLSTMGYNPLMVPAGPFIQVDLDQSIIGRAFDLDLGIVAEAGAFIQEFTTQAAGIVPIAADVQNRKQYQASIKSTYSPFADPAQYASTTMPIRPAALVRVLQETLPANLMLILDAGNCVGWGIHYFVCDEPQEVHSALAMGPMGFAAGAVVGAKLGRPSAACVALIGDGAFMMHGAEVSTAKRNKIGAIWIVLNDNELNMVVQGQEHFFPDKKNPEVWDALYDLGSPDLVGFAKSLGADAYEVRSPLQLSEVMPGVLAGAAAGVPQVIVAHIDRNDVPPYYNPIYAPPS